eukprot:TRINITY_DN10218_c0_g1_i1.p1 TRINITY_DN10218_c0_g1~~TRINITY_DN10218_c0_g1_i1.p1  ORF type:complete len:754 (-),score=182.37 TRINITY_DN10218_c0_g1_i1:47-2308(-)
MSWSQTPNRVQLTYKMKNIKNRDLEVTITSTSVQIQTKDDTFSLQSILAYEVIADESTYTLERRRLKLFLAKKIKGYDWPRVFQLKGDDPEEYIENRKALFNYTAIEPMEISFQELTHIQVIFKDESGWWTGKCYESGRIGVFPENHTEIYDGQLPDTGCAIEKCEKEPKYIHPLQVEEAEQGLDQEDALENSPELEIPNVGNMVIDNKKKPKEIRSPRTKSDRRRRRRSERPRNRSARKNRTPRKESGKSLMVDEELPVYVPPVDDRPVRRGRSSSTNQNRVPEKRSKSKTSKAMSKFSAMTTKKSTKRKRAISRANTISARKTNLIHDLNDPEDDEESEELEITDPDQYEVLPFTRPGSNYANCPIPPGKELVSPEIIRRNRGKSADRKEIKAKHNVKNRSATAMTSDLEKLVGDFNLNFLDTSEESSEVLEGSEDTIIEIRWGQFFAELISMISEAYNRIEDGKACTEFLTLPSDRLSIALTNIHGDAFTFGNEYENFPFKEGIWPFIYAFAIEKLGENYIDMSIGNEIVQEENSVLNEEDIPYNALTTAGKLTICSMLLLKMLELGEGELWDQIDQILHYLIEITEGNQYSNHLPTYLKNQMNPELLETSQILLEKGIIPPELEPHQVINLYCMIDSISSDISGVSHLAAIIANEGKSLGEKKSVIANPESLLHLLELEGSKNKLLLNETGFISSASTSGAFYIVLPGYMGISIYSPWLDENDAPVCAVDFCNIMKEKYDIMSGKYQFV